MEEEKEKKLSKLDESKKVLEELKGVEERLTVKIQELDTLQAEKMIGGTTEAGYEAPVIPEEKKKLLAAQEFFVGTQLEKDIRRANE